MKLSVEKWGTYNGSPCQRFTITHPSSGALATVTDLGATLLRVVRPDKEGNPVDVALTQETPDQLIGCRGYLGCSVGRVANRIGHARFELDGNEYKVAVTHPPHHLHGGIEGFHKKVWTVVEQEELENEVRLGFKYESADKEEGYPGTLTSTVTYHFEPNKIWWAFEATTDRPTIANLTNHGYWNLEGVGSKIDDQEIEIGATTFGAVDETCLPTGEIKSVQGIIDLRTHTKFSDVFAKFGDVDNNFFLDEARTHPGKNQREVHYCARAFSPKTGITLTIHTTEPCVQLYTGNFLNEVGESNGGIKLDKHYAFCLETQRVPDAINNPAFRDSVILRPDEVYYHKTVHTFGILQ